MPTVTLSKRIGNLCAKAVTIVMAMLVLILFMSTPIRHNVPKEGVSDRSASQQASQEVSRNASPVRADDVGDSNNKSAKIVTCPRCRLNALPRVKEFVYDHAKLFEPNLKVDFILGEDPVLHLYEDGKEVQKIDLESYDSKKIIQTIVNFGIHPKTETGIVREALGIS